ncbi:MAG TPA: IlvD/Edd family dehydratase [Solirubrobacteraceae bacterium]|nr:IlvD/Edd family dehydratase [Solirubrobacteraceae bacterium]
MTPKPLRSAAWFEGDDFDSFFQRSMLKTEGFTDDSMGGRPVIGIANTWSELTNCNVHLRTLAEHVKRGVLLAGGLPLEFPVISLSEPLMKPTTMMYRNLLSMDVEECIASHPLDAVVLLAGCDKTQPGCLMGAASADVPALMVTGGPMLNGHWRGRDLGSCSDCWSFYEQLRAGTLSRADWTELEGSIARSHGHCMTMGTASTMACVNEALGMGLPAGAAIPADDSRRRQLAERAGRQAVELARSGLRPSQVMTAAAFDNAIRVLHALGGSTNAVIHLIALAGRLGVELDLERFDELSESTPWLVNVKPSGEYLMEEFYFAGGVPALMAELRPLLDLEAMTVTGRTVGENIAGVEVTDRRLIASAAEPLSPTGGLVVLKGSLCPDGAVLKRTACDPRLLSHEGPAVVFEDIHDLAARVDSAELEIGPDSVMVLREAGPIGAPGMPEWGALPIPRKLLKDGVRDLLRISDARMSGTSYGAVVLHVAPESAVGGPLALVETGDRIRLDVDARRLDLLVEDRKLAHRLDRWRAPLSRETRGYRMLYGQHVLQANEGCDFDFLRGGSPVVEETRTYG